MKTLLLTCNHRYNIYCANILYENNVCNEVIIEDVFIHNKFTLLVKNLFKSFELFTNTKNFFYKILVFFYFEKFFGNKLFFDKNILGIQKKYELKDNILSFKVRSINSNETLKIINKVKPKVILVFGTSFIKKEIQSNFNCIAINLHSGISPNYRGEGIISALALNDMVNLGVTIHVLSEKSDSGDIFYQEKIKLNLDDNFYSIHLKTIKIGVELFVKVIHNLNANKQLRIKQDVNRGKFFGKKFMKNNTHYYFKAWKNLKKYKLINL